jgi:hypothetical protein
MVRIRRGKSENNEDIEFSRISIAGAAHDDFVYVYGITTKSGFFNGNNIYLFAKGL